MNNNKINRNKVVFLWVIVAILITASMAFASSSFAMTVKQVEVKQELEKQQLDLDSPVPVNWPEGLGENAVWVDPIDSPKYIVNLDSDENQNIESLAAPIHEEKHVSRLELFGWN